VGTEAGIPQGEARRAWARSTVLLATLVSTALVALLAVAAPAFADDSTPPQVTAFSITPAHVDTSAGDQTLKVTATIKDDQSGVDPQAQEVGLSSPDGKQYVAFFGLQRISGDVHAGVYSLSATMPRGSAGGVWRAWLMMQDNVGNSVRLQASDLDALLGVGIAEVTNDASTSDTTPPKITAFSLTPKQVDTTSQAQTVTATVTLADDSSGVTRGTFWLMGPEPGTQYTAADLTRVSGDASNGVYTGTVTLPEGSQPGSWTATIETGDAVGNSLRLDCWGLDAAFGAGSGEVTDVATAFDSTPPAVTSFSITPTEIDTETNDQTLTATVGLTDAQSGVRSAFVTLRPLIGTQEHEIFLSRISGDTHGGVWSGTCTLPRGSKVGMWAVVGLDATDVLGNEKTWQPSDINSLFPNAPGLLIANVAGAETVSIDSTWTIIGSGCAVTFPAGTVVMRQGGGPFAFYQMVAAPFTLDDSVPTTDLDGTPLATLRLGIPGLDLSFSQPVTVQMEVGTQYDGYRLNIQSLTEGGSAWANESSCPVQLGWISFTVSHATRFVANLTRSSLPKPKITWVSHVAGRRGSTVTILGTNFGKTQGTSRVKFGSAACGTYLTWTNTRIRCRVPTRAKLGSVKVIVVTRSGASNAEAFRIKR
jgi:hypothetical protein